MEHLFVNLKYCRQQGLPAPPPHFSDEVTEAQVGKLLMCDHSASHCGAETELGHPIQKLPGAPEKHTMDIHSNRGCVETNHVSFPSSNMVVALKELSIRGDFRTTVEYLVNLLETENFQNNDIDTGWLDHLIAERVQVGSRVASPGVAEIHASGRYRDPESFLGREAGHHARGGVWGLERGRCDVQNLHDGFLALLGKVGRAVLLFPPVVCGQRGGQGGLFVVFGNRLIK